MFPFILLASGSPRRHEILNQLGIPHAILRTPAPPGEDEPILPGEHPEDYVCRTAREKAQRAVAWLAGGGRPHDIRDDWPAHWQHAPILSADTTVILDGDILGKPADLQDAATMLARLSGREHQVRTAVVLAARGTLHEAVSVSTVQFRFLSPEDIRDYCASHEPLGKAGSYAIQGRAAAFIRHLSGSYSGVMGLPAFETSELLHSVLRG